MDERAVITEKKPTGQFGVLSPKSQERIAEFVPNPQPFEQNMRNQII